MALTVATSFRQAEHQFDTIYNGQSVNVMLCLIEESGIQDEQSISDWAFYELTASGYTRQTAIIGKNALTSGTSRCESLPIGVTFFFGENCRYDSVIAYMEGSTHPFFVSRLDEVLDIEAGESAGFNFVISTGVDSTETVVTATDPDYDSVVLLMHFDGEDGSTVFADNSKNNFQPDRILPFLGAQISTNQSKFGTSSLYLPSADACVDLDIAQYLEFGSSNFTIEFWILALAQSNSSHIFSIYDSSNNRKTLVIGLNSEYIPYVTFSPSNDGTGERTLTANESVLNQGWQHIAFSRFNSSVYFSVNGTSFSTFFSDPLYYSSSCIPCLGMRTASTSNDYHGFIDELRITLGVARYRSEVMTVPTAAFPNS